MLQNHRTTWQPRCSFNPLIDSIRVGILISVLTLFCLFGAFVPSASAVEGATVRTPHVTAQFLTAEQSWSQAKEHRLAIYFDILDGWHVYWKNPGDSGIPTTVRWRLPAGVKIKSTDWPYPERIPYGPLTNFGYHESTAILFTVDHSEFRGAESAIRIEADVDWLVCKETCIPESGTFRISIPLDGKAAVDEKSAATIDHFTSRIPRPMRDKKIRAVAHPNWVVLTIPRANLSDSLKDLDFFPEADLLLQHNNRPRFLVGKSFTNIYMSRNSAAGEKPPERFLGALVVGPDPTIAYEIDTRLRVSKKEITIPANAQVGGNQAGALGAHDSSPESSPMKAENVGGIGLLKALLFAFLGGLLLNLMPCVFPVLAIKVLGFVKHAGSAKAKLHGLIYGGGVLSSFVALGLLLVVLRAAGAQLGWGFHLQSPSFLSFLIMLLFAMTLNLFGFFEFMGSYMGIGQRLTEGDSKLSSFFTGVLAVIVATPCSAPFMGTAIGASLTLPPVYTLLVFLFLGLGLAAPYVLLSALPQLAKHMPKPGAWMQTFREALGFPMLGTCIWLVWVLAQQAGANGVVIQLSAMALLVFAIWLNRKVDSSFALPITVALVLLSVVFAVNGVGDAHDEMLKREKASGNKKYSFATDLIPWGTYSEAEIKDKVAAGKTVFVNFTAAWCLTCKVNERVAFASKEVRDLFKNGSAVGLIGDWTNRDPEITKALSRHNRLGVPLYLVYKPGKTEPEILPQVLTPQILLDALQK